MNSTKAYDNFAGIASIAAGVGGILYSVAFVILYLFKVAPDLGLTLASLLLLVGGLLSIVVVLAIYQHVRQTDSAFALLALVFAFAGLLGGAVHGAFDLANQLHPPEPDILTASNYPSQVDPRGLATFFLTGLGLVLFAWLMSRTKDFPRLLVQLTYALGILTIIIYLARLIILTPTNPVVLVVAGITGLVVNPAFYIWLGMTLRSISAKEK